MGGVRQRYKNKAAGLNAALEPAKGAKGGKGGAGEVDTVAGADVRPKRLFARVAEAASGRNPLSPEDALEAMHWVRQAIGVVAGLVFGAAGLEGVSPISLFLLSCFVIPNAYFQGQLRVDEDQVARVGSLKTEGLMSSIALFFLFWILAYTTFSR
jgi:EMC6